MGFDRTVVQDMTGSQPAFCQRAGDQQTAVTIERLAFSAHQADATFAHLVL